MEEKEKGLQRKKRKDMENSNMKLRREENSDTKNR